MTTIELAAPSEPQGNSLSQRAKRISIRSRMIILAAMVLAGIVVSNAVIISILRSDVALIRREAELFSSYASATDAVRSFGDLRYWLTDLAVSQLMNSERKARDAATVLRRDLEALTPVDPNVVARIQSQIDPLFEAAISASDAYDEGRRVVGNAMMAKVRDQFLQTEKDIAALSNVVSQLSSDTRQRMLQSADETLVLLLSIFVAVLTAGVIATLSMLRTIAHPLKVMHAAVVDLTAGKLDAQIPTDAPEEVASVGQALKLFRANMIERNALADVERRQRQTLSDAIETIAEGFALFDDAGTLLLCNTRLKEIFPHSAAMLKPGTSHHELWHSLAVESGAAAGADTVDSWLTEQAELRDASGSTREINYDKDRWVQVTERQSTNHEIVAVFRDVTNQKRREIELAEARDLAESANVSKSQFIANMSHELRTPLNAIIGYSEMLKEETEGLVDDELRDDLDKIRNAGRHLLALINDVLDLSKIESGKMQLDYASTDLPPLISEVIETIQPLADRNGNTLVLVQPAPILTLWTDGMRLKQSLMNLLSNACKFTNGGQVRIDIYEVVKDTGRFITFDVTDTGIGIPPEKLDRLFQQFSQVDASTTRKFGGTGLGLAISRHYCRMMGGDITVQSTLNVGSTFSIVLPLESHPSQQLSIETDTETRDMTDQILAGTILIIDDSENDRNLLRRYLEREGFEVVSASSGAEGLALMQRYRPAAVTLDIKMDHLDGWSVLEAIRRDPELSNTPVVMVSVQSEAERGRALGASGFITKPIDRDQLVPILEQLTGGGTVRNALVVDDDDASRTVLRRSLEARGWIVREAHNGLEALEAVRTQHPDMIMLDLMMPEADGFEVVEQLRRDASTAQIPILVVTAKDLTDAERMRLNRDVVGVLQKGAFSRTDIGRVVHATKLALAARGQASPTVETDRAMLVDVTGSESGGGI